METFSLDTNNVEGDSLLKKHMIIGTIFAANPCFCCKNCFRLLFVWSQHLLQGAFQQLLPLLALQQQTLPALVELIQLVPQVAGLVTRRRLQEFRSSTFHGLHRGMMGKHIVA